MTEKEMLAKLLKDNFWINEKPSHFKGPGLEWSWKEGYTVGDEDPELNRALIEWIKENNIDI